MAADVHAPARDYDPAKDFIDTQDYERAELEGLLGLIELLKDADRDGACPELLKDVSLGMIFEEPSTRTRVSFEVAMVKLGGHALYLRPGEIHMGVRESLYDTAKVLSRMVAHERPDLVLDLRRGLVHQRKHLLVRLVDLLEDRAQVVERRLQLLRQPADLLQRRSGLVEGAG